MDETSVISVTQQYYIAAKSSPADERASVLKYGKMFSVFDHRGDIQTTGLGEQGIFFEGTRHLSELILCLWKVRPLPLSSAVKANNFVFTADLTNLDVSHEDRVAIPRGTLHLQRSKFLWHDVCYEEFAFTNFGPVPLLVPFSLKYDADFDDIFEVRGMHRQKKGKRLEDQIENDAVVLSYEGLDRIVRETRLQCDPVPNRISGTELEFEVHLQPEQKEAFHLSVACDAKAKANSVSYSSAMISARNERKKASENFPRISSSNSRLSDWIEHSVADVQMMILGNPETNYPYAGVPWFSTVFGRDGIITALQLLWLRPEIAKGVLQYLAATQATEFNSATEAEPGKILHETRGGEMATLGEIPFGRYYGSVDVTPLFIYLAGAYYDRTGDEELLKRVWPNVELALQWIDEYGDMDGDGFVEYARRSSNGLVQQGWKDSNDSIFHADGKLARAPIALCEVQGYVYAAKLAAARLSEALGNKERGAALRVESERLRAKFEEEFWCEEISTYALALDADKKPCQVRTSNAGQCLYTGIARPDKARRVGDTLLNPDSFSGWGIRTVAAGQANYNPLSYHNGSVWPHDNSLIVSGLAKYDCKHQAARVLLGHLDASRWANLRRLPELFCGLERRRGEGPTLYPVACSPQAWASGAVFLMVQACLGASVRGDRNQIVFVRPYLPEGIPQLWIHGLRTGDASVDLFFERRNETVRVEVTHQEGGAEVVATL